MAEIKPLPEATVVVEATIQTTGRLVLSLILPTPLWATWIFRTEFVLNKALMIWVALSGFIRDGDLKKIIFSLAVFDFLTWAIGRCIGIKEQDLKK